MEPILKHQLKFPADVAVDTPQFGNRLDSWKSIALYLGRSEKTVRRWEASEQLPVHRLMHEKRGSVYAYRGELDAWRERRKACIGPGAFANEPRTHNGTYIGSPAMAEGNIESLIVANGRTGLQSGSNLIEDEAARTLTPSTASTNSRRTSAVALAAGASMTVGFLWLLCARYTRGKQAL